MADNPHDWENPSTVTTPVTSEGWESPPIQSDGWEAPLAQKEVSSDFWSEFNANVINPITEPGKAWDTVTNDNLFVNIGHGIGRIAADVKEGGSLGEELAKELHSVWKSDIKTAKEFDWKTFKENLVAHPGAVAAGVVNSVISDPELAIVPFGFGGKFAEGAGEAALKAGKVMAKVAAVGARATESAVTGAGLSAEITSAEQFKTGNYNLADVWHQAELGAVQGGTFGFLAGIKNLGDIDAHIQAKFNQAKAEVSATKSLDQQTLDDLLTNNQSNTIAKALKKAKQLVEAGATKEHIAAIAERNPIVAAAVNRVLHTKEEAASATPKQAFTPEATANDAPFAQGQQEMGFNLPPTQRRMTHSEVLKYLGMGTVGAVAGQYLDPNNPEAAAILGGIAGATGLLGIAAIGKVAKDMWKPMIVGTGMGAYILSDSDPKKSHPWEGAGLGLAAALGFKALTRTKTDANVRIADGMIWQNLNNKQVYARNIWSIKTAMDREVPRGDRQANITRYIDGSAHSPLTDTEKAVAQAAQDFFAETGKAAKKAGVIEQLRDHYVTHIIDWSNSTPSEISATRQAILNDLSAKSRTFTTTSRFGKARTYDTIDELNKVLGKYGAKLKTENISEIISLYGNSMRKAIEDRTLLKSLRQMTDVYGRRLIDKPSKDNQDYVLLPHPALQAHGILKVHPELADSLRFLLDNHIGPVPNGAYFLTMAAKRMEVAANFFHARSLIDVAIGAGVGREGLKAVISGVPGLKKLVREPTVLDSFRKGSLNDDISLLISKGLKVQLPEDVNPEQLNDLMSQSARWIDGNFMGGKKVAGKVSDSIIKMNDALHKVTWEHGYTGIKLTIALKQLEVALAKNAKERVKNPEIPLMSKEQAAEKAASFANDMTGGVDWFGLAKNTQSSLMRKIAMTTFSQRGRLWMQVGMFAPDWTFATFRSVYKALPGVTNDKVLRSMYRRYVFQAAGWYLGFANLANMAFTGHSIFGNKDWTTVELGDGRKMYLSKHTMEFVHWMQKPKQEMYNKLGILPAEAIEQFTQKEFLSAKGTAPDMGDPLSHALKKFVPLPLQQTVEGSGVAGAISSFFGSPVYGQKTEEKRAKKQEKALRLSDFGKKGIGSLTGE